MTVKFQFIALMARPVARLTPAVLRGDAVPRNAMERGPGGVQRKPQIVEIGRFSSDVRRVRRCIRPAEPHLRPKRLGSAVLPVKHPDKLQFPHFREESI